MFGLFRKKRAAEAEAVFLRQIFIAEQQRRLESAGGKEQLDEESAIRFFAVNVGEAAARASFGKGLSSKGPDIRANAVAAAFTLFSCHAACAAVGIAEGQPRVRYISDAVDCVLYAHEIDRDVLRQSLELGQRLYGSVSSNDAILAKLKSCLLRYRFDDAEEIEQMLFRVAREVAQVLDESLV